MRVPPALQGSTSGCLVLALSGGPAPRPYILRYNHYSKRYCAQAKNRRNRTLLQNCYNIHDMRTYSQVMHVLCSDIVTIGGRNVENP